MSQTITHIDPLSTDGVLKHMCFVIDEIKLLRSIDSLTEQIRLSQTPEFDPSRKRYLISELRFLNKRLHSLRERARPR